MLSQRWYASINARLVSPIIVNSRSLPSAHTFLAVLALGCSGRVSADERSDAGGTDGGAGSGGGATAGGASSQGGSAANASTGGFGTGGAAGRVSTGGAPAGGTASGGSAGALCPPTAPALGSRCTGGLQCTYGDICCGGGYVCDSSGTWQRLAVGCGCRQPPPPPVDAGPVSCGAETCSSTEVCVHPAYNFCGPQPPCVPELDGGECPAGTTRMQYCGGSSSGGCVAIPKPGPPHCSAMPSACGANPSCVCLPKDVCGPSGVDVCSSVEGRDVSCLCTAP